VCSLLIIFACFVGVAICLCRRSPTTNGINGTHQTNGNGNGNFSQVQSELSFATGDGSCLTETFPSASISLFPHLFCSVSDQHQRNKWLEALDTASGSDHASANGERHERQPHDSEELQPLPGDDVHRWSVDESQVSDGTGSPAADQCHHERRVVRVRDGEWSCQPPRRASFVTSHSSKQKAPPAAPLRHRKK
jgi:hypothetical protein